MKKEIIPLEINRVSVMQGRPSCYSEASLRRSRRNTTIIELIRRLVKQ